MRLMARVSNLAEVSRIKACEILLLALYRNVRSPVHPDFRKRNSCPCQLAGKLSESQGVFHESDGRSALCPWGQR